jgi:hypothetical protein
MRLQTSSVFCALASASRARSRYSLAGDDIQDQRPGSVEFRNPHHTQLGCQGSGPASFLLGLTRVFALAPESGRSRRLRRITPGPSRTDAPAQKFPNQFPRARVRTTFAKLPSEPGTLVDSDERGGLFHCQPSPAALGSQRSTQRLWFGPGFVP